VSSGNINDKDRASSIEKSVWLSIKRQAPLKLMSPKAPDKISREPGYLQSKQKGALNLAQLLLFSKFFIWVYC
jgi:hypothetical protein